MHAPTPRNLTPWRALATSALAFGCLAGEVAAQAPVPSSNSPPAQASAAGPGPAQPKPEPGRVEGTVTFSWASGGDPSSPMAGQFDRGGPLRGPVETIRFRRPSFATVTIAAYPVKASPSGSGLQEPNPRNPKAPVATALPDSNGRFSMVLEPGEYELVAISETRADRTDRVPTRSFKVRIESGKTERCLFSF